MEVLNAYAHNQLGDQILGCGTSSLTAAPSLVGFFKMANNGVYQYFFQIATTTNALCKGITYEDNTQTISILFTTDDGSFKNSNTGFVDAVLL